MRLSNLPVVHSKRWGLNDKEYTIETKKIDDFRYETRLPEALVQFYVNAFTLAGRTWQSYSVDKVEVMLRYVGLINGPTFYHNYDPDTQELIFRRTDL